MVKEAEKFKEEDEKIKAQVEAKNALESLCFSLKSTMADEKIKDKISEEDKKSISDKVEEILQWMTSSPNAEKDE
jgi:heat shock protein 1/8